MASDPENEQYLPHDQQEGMEDLALAGEWYLGPSLWSTDWTTETIVSQLKRGNINLNPRFQRRNAWGAKRKSLFIESLIMGLPVPQLILAEEKGKRGSFIVIDGKQRLLTLRQFAAKQDGDDFRQLKLIGLEDRDELNNITYDELKKRPDLETELNTFENQTIRTVVIRGWQDEKYLYSVFLRINNGSVQLSPQELRQALHPGAFSDFIDDFSATSEPLKSALKLKEPDFRMRDVELVLRYFAYRNFARTYEGNLKLFLDLTTKQLNKSWKHDENRLRTQAGDLDSALAATRQIFGQRDELRKWNGTSYERPMNRAVFDIMTFYFSDPDIRNRALILAAEIKAAFQHLCENDRGFLAALEATTKSMEANQTRFKVWADELSRIFQIPVQSPLQ